MTLNLKYLRAQRKICHKKGNLSLNQFRKCSKTEQLFSSIQIGLKICLLILRLCLSLFLMHPHTSTRLDNPSWLSRVLRFETELSYWIKHSKQLSLTSIVLSTLRSHSDISYVVRLPLIINYLFVPSFQDDQLEKILSDVAKMNKTYLK